MKRWKEIGWIACMSAAIGCLLIGLFGIVMILYWHHVTHDWGDDHVFFWIAVGMPSTIGALAFSRTSGLFK